ncbi:MAG: EamA family transporter RarD [Parahaliea sp.]
MQDQQSTRAGLLAALSAFFIWGLAPLYFKALSELPAPEILAHRSIWSLVLALAWVAALGGLSELRSVLGNPRLCSLLALTAVLIGSNWLVFIWSIGQERVTEASLGYYINPLVNVLLGVCFLGERLRPLQWLAVLLAALGIGHEIWQFGRLPLVALFLALSFGFYALLRKRAPVASLTGLTVETLYLFPLALGYLLWSDSPTSNLFNNSVTLNALLVFAGPLTLVPLLLFNFAAQRLMLSTLGILQYLGPSLMLVLAVTVFGEPFSRQTLLSFALVWCGLLIFTLDMLGQRWRQRRRRQSALGRPGRQPGV